MKPLPLLFSLVLTAGCGSCGDDAVEAPPVDPNAGTGPAVEPPPAVDPLQQALAQLDAGLASEALAFLETALAAKPDDDSLWFAVELAAIGGGKAGDLLDRLSVTDAIGGQSARHHALRATLALAAGRPGDAFDAAQALRDSDPGAAAAFRARIATLPGAPALGTLDPAVPADALVMLAKERDPKKLKKLLETAATVEGWRAALARAEVSRGLGDTAAAQAEAAKVAEASDPRAAVPAIQLRLLMATDPRQTAMIAMEGSKRALSIHDGAQAAQLLDQAVAALQQVGAADEAWDAIKAAIAALPETGGPSVDRATVLLFDVGLESGHIAETLEAGRTALAAGDLGDRAPALARGLARVAWRTCDMSALQAAGAALQAPEASWIGGMEALCTGDLSAAREKLAAVEPGSALGVEAALARAWAWYGTPEALPAATAAVAAADAHGSRTARIESALVLERLARLAGDGAAASRALASLEPDAGPALQMEIFSRKMVAGLPAAPPPASAGEPPLLAGWRALAGVPAAPAPAGSETSGIAAWAEGRQLLASGDAVRAAAAYRRAASSLPVQLQGRWAPLLTLDGAEGPDAEPDIRLAVAQVGAGGEEALLALHESSHYRAFKDLAAEVGYDWTLGVEADAARAFRTAAAIERARTLLWLAGTSTFPEEARAAARAALPAATCAQGMAPPMTLAELRAAFPETAVFSLRLGTTAGELLLVTPNVAKVKRFDDPRAIRAAANAYLDALGKGPAFGGSATDPRAGDRFRREVIDSMVGELVGIARYLVVAEPEMLLLPWAVLPEQVEGRRYLADIRTVAALPYIGPAKPAPTPPEGGYKPDFLGICRESLPDLEHMTAEELAITDDVTRTMLEAGLKPQGETSSIAQLFGGGYSVVYQGSEATLSTFNEAFPTARYIHLAGVPMGRAAGFAWADGHSALPVLACGATAARLVLISTGPSPEVQLVRAQALRDAGAVGVLVAMWNTPPMLRSRYLKSVYDALNRERTPARALAEARESLMAAQGADSNLTDPSYWGAFLYIGAP